LSRNNILNRTRDGDITSSTALKNEQKKDDRIRTDLGSERSNKWHRHKNWDTNLRFKLGMRLGSPVVSVEGGVPDQRTVRKLPHLGQRRPPTYQLPLEGRKTAKRVLLAMIYERRDEVLMTAAVETD
jgi:hypothetical protein